MGIHGVDVSNYQATFDFTGWQFALVKASEGDSFRDFRFWQHVNAARAAGLLVAAYHYQRNVSARAQYNLIRSIVPTSMPVVIDVEEGSGPLSITRELVGLLREGGYSVPLTYIPRWYWQNIGRPSLAGLPPLWASDYRGTFADWSDYGGLTIKLRQYTSTPHDKNYFDGTREELAALLGGKEDDMQLSDEFDLFPSDRREDTRVTVGEFYRWTESQLGILGEQVAELREREVEVDYDKLADKLAERGVKADVDYQKVGEAVVAELKKEGN